MNNLICKMIRWTNSRRWFEPLEPTTQENNNQKLWKWMLQFCINFFFFCHFWVIFINHLIFFVSIRTFSSVNSTGILIEDFLYYWLIDFNSMSNRQTLFYAERLGNRVHCTFILTFLLYLFKSFFNSPIEYK